MKKIRGARAPVARRWLASRAGLVRGWIAGAALATASIGGHTQDFLADGARVVVATTSGPVVGLQADRVQTFRGIPYAAAPVRELRFLPAIPPRPWKDPKDARARGAACPQVLDLEDPAEDGDSNMSEDCLTVNVWTPGADSKARPVMVFIHGGALEEGSAADTSYDGAALAVRGDLVVVTVQYRLGVLGFLELGEVGGPRFADSGNLGILDQIMALRWVQANVGGFGGDPRNVTVFGESAGGASIHGLLAIPAARDLFRRAIIESGDPGQFLSIGQATAISARFMALANAHTIKELGGLSVEELMRAQSKLLAQDYGNGTFGMVQDGRTFDKTPIETLSANAGLSKPMIVGSNSEEMRYYIALNATPLDRQPQSILQAHLVRVFGAPARNVLDVYTSDSESYPEAVTRLIGDIMFRMPSIRLAELNCGRQPTFVYLFTFRSSTKGPTGLEYGAMHGLEIPVVFHLDSALGYMYVGPKGTWNHLSDQMMDAWTRFARTGDPNGPGLPHWPRYDSAQHATMEFGAHTDVALDPYGAERRAWDEIPSRLFEQSDAVRFADPPAE
ncbi:MAG TPA: carboxylesterase/lipase family protein [Steroidobacteraceae bacterium]|nr:carboxylesterase/lipase family protein [Steroidobacteraceae bacterium]